MRTSPTGPVVMCASPLPFVNSRVTGPLTVYCRSKLPSTPECETQPAENEAVRTKNASHPFVRIRVIELGFALKMISAEQSFLSSYTKTRNWKFREHARSFDLQKGIERTLAISLRINRSGGEARLLDSCQDLLGNGGLQSAGKLVRSEFNSSEVTVGADAKLAKAEFAQD